MSEVLNKIKEYFKINFKRILFIVIFLIICLIYNQNNQNLNFLLKRGILLEYSPYSASADDIKKIENKLLNLNFKFSSITQNDNILYIGLPILAREDKKDEINKVSDFIFDNYNSELISVKTLNDSYHTPYAGFLKFLAVLFVSFVIWLILLYLTTDGKEFLKDLKVKIKNYVISKKDGFLNSIKEIKEHGILKFVKKLMASDGAETDITKEIISTIVFVLVCVILIRYFIGELRWIPSGSMRPTILEKDRVFVEKLEFPHREIKRGDILVFYPPEVELSNSPWAVFTRLSGIFCRDVAFIKRTVGMPGDKFEIKYDPDFDEYAVYINEAKLDEPYIISKDGWTQCSENMYCGPFVIPKGHYFMMGDNRGNSQDSRFWGFLDENRIIGRANFMFFPISRINLLRDKYLKLHNKKQNGKYTESDFIINRYEFLYKI